MSCRTKTVLFFSLMRSKSRYKASMRRREATCSSGRASGAGGGAAACSPTRTGRLWAERRCISTTLRAIR